MMIQPVQPSRAKQGNTSVGSRILVRRWERFVGYMRYFQVVDALYRFVSTQDVVEFGSLFALFCSRKEGLDRVQEANSCQYLPRAKLFAISSNSSSDFPRKYSAYSSHNSSESRMFRTTRATCLSVVHVLGYLCLIEGAAFSIHSINGSKMGRTGISSHPHSSSASCYSKDVVSK